MSMVSGFFSAAFWGLLLLSLLCVIHEAGHFLMARLFGCRVTEFFIGLPCRWRLSFKSRKFGTEFGVTPLLLGGYNRICGMGAEYSPLMADVLGVVQDKGRVSADEVAQTLGCDESDALACLIGLTEWASIEPYYDPELDEHPWQNTYPERFQTTARDAAMLTAFDSGNHLDAQGSTQAGEPHAVDDAHALLDSERAHVYDGLSAPKRIATLIAGVVINVVFGFALVMGLLMIGGVEVISNVNVISGVSEGSLAAQAGLEPGDAITSINGQKTDTWADVINTLDPALVPGTTIELTYERDGVETSASLALDATTTKLGIIASTEQYHLSFGEAFDKTCTYIGAVATAIASLVQPAHTAEVLQDSTSIVGVSIMASQAASEGLASLVRLTAAISLSLGFMNLLPIPPLDGGKILFELIAGVTRHKVPLKVQNAISYVGLFLFVALFVYMLRSDLINYVIG